MTYTVKCRDVPRNLKRGGGGGAQFSVSVFTENIGEDQKKKVFTSFDVQFTPHPPKSSEDQEKGHRVLRCPVSTVALTGDISQLIFQWGRGGADPAAPPWVRP